MNHKLGLQEVYYRLVKSGIKIYEGRLNDEKRKLMNVGDTIEFLKDPDRVDSFQAIIVNRYEFSSFNEMVDKLELKKLGFIKESKEEIIKVYHQFYSSEDESKYGVVVFEVKVL